MAVTSLAFAFARRSQRVEALATPSRRCWFRPTPEVTSRGDIPVALDGERSLYKVPRMKKSLHDTRAKALQLAIQTVRELSTVDLQRVAGGALAPARQC